MFGKWPHEDFVSETVLEANENVFLAVLHNLFLIVQVLIILKYFN